MRVTLIHNPSAGPEDIDSDHLVSLIRDAGHEVVNISVKDDDYRSLLESPGDVVAVAGGDGTVRKVATKLIGSGIPIAILPVGTANNVSRSLGIEGHLEEMIAKWETAPMKSFDVGKASAPWGDATFIEGMGLGLFAKTMSILTSSDKESSDEFDDAEEKLERDLKALKGILSNYNCHNLNMVLDGKDRSGEYLLVAALNMNYIGPNLHLGPDSDPTDGYLDFIFVPEQKRDELSQYLLGRLEGKEEAPQLDVVRGRHLRLQWDGVEMHIDGKIWPDPEKLADYSSGAIDVRVEHGALEFLCPTR
jgi:diacylglycerol kinase family enzyme